MHSSQDEYWYHLSDSKCSVSESHQWIAQILWSTSLDVIQNQGGDVDWEEKKYKARCATRCIAPLDCYDSFSEEINYCAKNESWSHGFVECTILLLLCTSWDLAFTSWSASNWWTTMLRVEYNDYLQFVKMRLDNNHTVWQWLPW